MAKTLTIKSKNGDLNSMINEDDLNIYEAGFLRFYENTININFPNINYIFKTIEETINDINKKGIDFIIHSIWYCVSEKKINNIDNNILNKLMEKYQNKIQFFINFLNPYEKDINNYNNFKKDFDIKFHNKKYQTFNISSENIFDAEQLNEIINKLKTNFVHIVFNYIKEKLNIYQSVERKIKNIKIEKNLNDMPNLFSKYFEKIFGNKHDIVQYTYKYLSALLIKYETSIEQNIINIIFKISRRKK